MYVGKRAKKSRACDFSTREACSRQLTLPIAVTLEGTVIHKSGLMTGGRSSQNSGKKWDEKDIQGKNLPSFSSIACVYSPSTGYYRAKDALLAQLRDLRQAKPKANTEQNIISEIGRLESQLTVARDDLVNKPAATSHKLSYTSLRTHASFASRA